MFETAKTLWVRWRESRRQYQIDRAVFKASGGMEQYAHQRDGDLSTITGSTGGTDAAFGAAGAGGVAGGGLGGTST